MKGSKVVSTVSPEMKTTGERRAAEEGLKTSGAVGSRHPIPWGGWLAGLGLLAFLVLLGLGLYQKGLAQVQSGSAPNFTLTTYDGQTVRLSGLRGQVVVINFWASWCQPCHQEAPLLEATWREYRERGVVFIGVDYLDTEPEARAYISEYHLTYPNGPDLGSRIAQAYRIKGVPETYFVDRKGLLQGVFIGPLTQDELHRHIDSLLATK